MFNAGYNRDENVHCSIALTSLHFVAGNLCCAVSMTMPNQKMLTTTLPATGGRLQWPDDLEL